MKASDFWLFKVNDCAFSFSLKPNKVGENKLNDVLQLLEYIGPSEGGDELQSILMNEHFRQLMISHDLISSQIYQSPTLRLYPSGNIKP